MTIPLQFASLYDHQEVFVRSICLLDLGTDFCVDNMVFVKRHGNDLKKNQRKGKKGQTAEEYNETLKTYFCYGQRQV